jgi:hypothetical protein
MLNYQQIEALYGAPLNTVPRPKTPFRIKTWHVIAIGVGVFVLYKGIRKISEDYFTIKSNKKNDNQQF